jgi:hypothetical protein
LAPVSNGASATYLGWASLSYLEWIKGMALKGFPSVPTVSMSDFSYPSTLYSKTIQYCSRGDAVCDIGFLLKWPQILVFGSAFDYGVQLHTSYSEAALKEFGASLRKGAVMGAR